MSSITYAQVPFSNVSPSASLTAERNSTFKTSDSAQDFLEITNSTHYNNSFIPSIWGHQQTDPRFVLRMFATTIRDFDAYFESPVMMFRAEVRNHINLNAPSGSMFPWGDIGEPFYKRLLFAWENSDNRIMTILANGNVGINTPNPTAILHTKSKLVRFEDLEIKDNDFFIMSDKEGYITMIPKEEIINSDKILTLIETVKQQQEEIDLLKKMLLSNTNEDSNSLMNSTVNFNIYPNPSENNDISLEVFNFQKEKNYDISITNLEGKLLKKIKLTESKLILSRHTFSSNGIYLITLYENNKMIKSEKLIIK